MVKLCSQIADWRWSSAIFDTRMENDYSMKPEMRKLLFLVIACLVCTEFGFPQAAPETTMVVLAREGQRFRPQNSATLHYLEAFQVRHKWVLPDVGYIDFGHSNYREVFMGGGYVLYDGKHISVTEEGLFIQASGSSTDQARYVMPWTMIQYHLTEKLGGEAVYFPYIPLNNSGRKQHVLERAKLERKIAGRWKAGAGLGGYKFADEAWSNRPFVTTTVSTRWGDWEFWLQRLPENKPQFQIRYAIARQH
jgi:hypothetical protein